MTINFYRQCTKQQLLETLAQVPDGENVIISTNQVNNLSILKDGEYVAYVELGNADLNILKADYVGEGSDN